jgi:catechol O-methyltransferase
MSLKQRVPLLRWSFWRMATGARNITTTGQVGDGREAAAVEYVLSHARAGDIDDVIATIDRFAYEKSMLINVGDEKGELLDAAVRRADPKLALELGTYCGYGALRIARAAPGAKVYSVELAEANAANARQIWAHAGVADRITCVVGTIGDGGRTLDALASEHEFSSGALDFVFLDHDKDAYLVDLQSILDPGLAAQRVDRGGRQCADSRRAQVPRIHAPAAGHVVGHHRAQGTPGIPEPGLGSGAGVAVPGVASAPAGGLRPTLRGARAR